MGYNAKMNEGGVKKDLPAAVLLAKSGELSDRVKQLLLRLEDCDICPHLCRVNRLKGDIGKCGIANLAQVAASCAHHGEEPVLSGKNGAGNVFLTGCNLRCCYCQNYQISSRVEMISQVIMLMLWRLFFLSCKRRVVIT